MEQIEYDYETFWLCGAFISCVMIQNVFFIITQNDKGFTKLKHLFTPETMISSKILIMLIQHLILRIYVLTQ